MPEKQKYKKLRLILGDQLNIDHSWFQKQDEQTLYCLFELRQETDYVKHHIQKICGFFLAMRAFAEHLRLQGHQVLYYEINHPKNKPDITDNIRSIISEYSIKTFEYQYPDEYRLDVQLTSFCKKLAITTAVYDSEHFFTQRDELATFFKGKKQWLMESFYRNMRRRENILMINHEPVGGLWNYDKENRKTWKAQATVPQCTFNNDAQAILDVLAAENIAYFGTIDHALLDYPITQAQALEQLNFFCQHLLARFGDNQDIMQQGEAYLHHSRLSFALNVKLISPRQILYAVLKHYENNPDCPLNSVEGFVRQILGWREYVRGIYWAKMPEYAHTNALFNHRPLPDFYWTGQTKMNCMAQTIKDSLGNAYAHHIQRLMITGNFALLTQINPSEVDSWYLGIYIDAIEWVQLPNTHGMSQWADGGLIATKPYISSAAYINKMSNYCSKCQYDFRLKTEENACPFNSLYWHFLSEKRCFFENNQRMSMMLALLDKMDKTQLQKIKNKAQHIIENPDEY